MAQPVGPSAVSLVSELARNGDDDGSADVSVAWWAAAVILLVAGCAQHRRQRGRGIGTGPRPAELDRPRRRRTRARAPQTHRRSLRRPVRPQPTRPIWLQSLQMTSATYWVGALATRRTRTLVPVPFMLARPHDRRRPDLDGRHAARARVRCLRRPTLQVLDPVDGEHAYLAVTVGGAESNAASVNTTGSSRPTTAGAPGASPRCSRRAGDVSQLSFADRRKTACC